MAKRKKHKKATRRGMKRWEMAVLGGVALLLVWGGWTWWQDQAIESRFLELAGTGAGALSRVERGTDAGGGHLGPGQSAGYRQRFPTSGRHNPQWLGAGIYTVPQPAERLVHSLEHGMVVIYIDTPSDEVRAMLESWAGLYGGSWSGIVITPAPGLGEAVLLNAWNNTLRLDAFEPAAAAAFVDRFRGRGPEHPVR